MAKVANDWRMIVGDVKPASRETIAWLMQFEGDGSTETDRLIVVAMSSAGHGMTMDAAIDYLDPA